MKEIKIDIFGDGMRIFLDYIARQLKKNPDYEPHPLIKAFELAIEGTKKIKNGETTAGLSFEHKEDEILNPYIIIAEKIKDRIEIKEIRNLQVNKELPLDLMIMIFRLQIILDRIPGNTVSPAQMADSLNKVIPEKPFYPIGEKWKEARDNFQKLLRDGKIHLPEEMKSSKLIDELSKITNDTPWEEYSPMLRSLIGMGIADPQGKKANGKIFITSPTKAQIEKSRVFEILTEYIMGKTADYLRPKKVKIP